MTATLASLHRLVLPLILLGAALHAQQNRDSIPYGNNTAAGRTIVSDGARIYYETYGAGAPLLLIHGNGGSIAYMKPQIEHFSKTHTVIVMDCRGRGRSELGSDSLTYRQMTRDVAAILNELHLDSTLVVGRSDGGIIALLLAIHHPAKVKKAVVFAANLTPDTLALDAAFYREVKRERAHADSMLAARDSTQNWNVIRQRNRLMEFQPHITARDLRNISCPVLVMSTDRDIIRLEHTVHIYRCIPNANLCILAGEDHYVTANNPALFNRTVDTWLRAPFVSGEAH